MSELYSNSEKDMILQSLKVAIARVPWIKFAYKRYQEILTEFLIRRSSDHVFVVSELNSSPNSLDRLGLMHGTDKVSPLFGSVGVAWPPHGYTRFYNLVFRNMTNQTLVVLECGIGSTSSEISSNMGPQGIPGASLRMWRDYFLEAHVIGGDIDRNILFCDERIRSFHLNQTDPDSINGFLGEIGDVQLDIIIDDGLHTFDAGRFLFEHMWHKLSLGGLYFIEDVEQKYLRQYICYFARSGLSASIVRFSARQSWFDNNCLIMIEKISS